MYIYITIKRNHIIKTQEIKKQALNILNANGGNVKLSDFTVKQAKQLIKENNFLNKASRLC
jgi:hypothetical protein